MPIEKQNQNQTKTKAKNRSQNSKEIKKRKICPISGFLPKHLGKTPNK